MIEKENMLKGQLRGAYHKLMPIYFLSLVLSLVSLYAYFSTYSSAEFIASAALVTLNFILVILFDGQLVKTLKFLFWGVAMKLVKSFFLILVLAGLAITGAVKEPKTMIIGFSIGFFVGHAVEVFILTKLLVFNKVTHAK